MARKTAPVSSSHIDWDVPGGGCVADKDGERNLIQQRLYKITNPYVGSKRAILPDIAKALDDNDVTFSSMLDLFCGSSVVSIFFKMLGKQVISNDLLTSSYYNALTFVENNEQLVSKDDLGLLLNKENALNVSTFVTNHYAERFTPKESQVLDTYRTNVDTYINKLLKSRLNESLSHHCATKEEYDNWWAGEVRKITITDACLIVAIEHYILKRCYFGGRLNNGQVLSDLKYRLNHRNKGREMLFNMTVPLTFSSNVPCRAYNLDAIDATQEIHKNHPNIEMAYLDPPYGQQQSDYASMFAFCEEYIYGQKLETLPHIVAASKKFASKKDYQEHFREVLHGISWIPIWVVSFNASSFDDAESIANMLRDFKKDVTVVNIDHEYRYRKERGTSTEYLFIAR